LQPITAQPGTGVKRAPHFRRPERLSILGTAALWLQEAADDDRAAMTAVLPIGLSRPPQRRRSQAAALILVLVAHAVLIGLAATERAEIRALIDRSEAPPPAIPVILWPTQPRTAATRSGGRAAVVHPRMLRKRKDEGAVAIPSAPTAPAAPAAGAGAVGGPGEGGGPGWPSFGPNLARRMRPEIGCAHPDAYRLSDQERAHCDEELGQQARNAHDLGVGIPPGKQAVYDLMLNCRRNYDNNNTPQGTQASNAPGDMRGLGYIPDARRDCPPGEH
jgi:hypothetical protein